MQLIRRLRRIALRQFVGPAFLVLVSLFVGGLIGEVMIRLVAPQIFPIHPPGMYVEDPDLGYVLSPGFSGVLERPEFRDTIEIGEFGFRGASPRAKGENSLTVLVLGDSQAFGFGTAEDETYSVLLEQMLAAAHPGTDVQVLNGGVPGYGTADQLALLESRGPAVDPDLVIVTFLSVNDLVENLTPASTWARVEDG
ncbi:MAG: SGNH/GDSL hydrolase family protein, partial [Gemmatimonadota bacterium]